MFKSINAPRTNFWAENWFIYNYNHTTTKCWSCCFFENLSFYEYTFSFKRKKALENENKTSLRYLLSLIRLYVCGCTYSHTQQEDRLSRLKLSEWRIWCYELNTYHLELSLHKSHTCAAMWIIQAKARADSEAVLQCSTGFIWVL